MIATPGDHLTTDPWYQFISD